MTRVSLFSLAVASALEPCLDSDYAAGTWVPAAISREALDAGNGSHNSFAWDEVNATCVSRTLRWTWAPTRCAITPFARDAFLAALSHKHVLFVGDSITEKHFESLRLMMGAASSRRGFFTTQTSSDCTIEEPGRTTRPPSAMFGMSHCPRIG